MNIDVLFLLEFQDPVQYFLILLRLEMGVVTSSVPGVAGVEPDAPESSIWYLGS